jgi:hypothetical protein
MRRWCSTARRCPDFLIGSQIDQGEALYTAIAEGGNIDTLPQAVSYRVCDLGAFQATGLPATEKPRALLAPH